jgi:3',5'-cyclic AMP phosphodiesterase CpdA
VVGLRLEMSTFVLAHLSDPHLAPLPTPNPFELVGKRLTGFVNWHWRRRNVHRPDVLDRIVADLKARAPDHIAVTGDLVNLSLAAEFPLARSWLEHLGPPQDVTVVPGNHDTYVWSKARHPQRHWAEYMRGDPGGLGDLGDRPAATEDPDFPFVRRRGPVALIGMTTAVPTPPFRATGRVGKPQLARLALLLDELARAGAFRIVLIHHAPVTRPQWRDRRLIDGEDFIGVLKRHGAELVLHGHEHLDLVRWFETPLRPVPAVGVPSASWAGGGNYDAAAYNLYAIAGAPGGWRCEMVVRGLAGDGRITERKRCMLLAG